jgi:hypothetical protein
MLMDSLAVYGLTPSVLQVLIVAGVVLVIIGMYWHYILAGSAVLFTLFVFASGNTNTDTPVEPTKSVIASKPIEQVEQVETEKQRWHRQFMEDCITITENSKETCENIWNDRMMDESHLEVNPEAELSNASYKKTKRRFL